MGTPTVHAESAPPAETATGAASSPTAVDTPSQPDAPATPKQQARQAKRQERVERVLDLRAQGQSLRQIARATDLSKGCVVRYLRAGRCPDWNPGRPTPTQLDPFAAAIDAWIGQGGRNAAALYRELKAQGCQASYDAVRRYLARRLGSTGRPGPRPSSPLRAPLRAANRPNRPNRCRGDHPPAGRAAANAGRDVAVPLPSTPRRADRSLRREARPRLTGWRSSRSGPEV
jgi:hypothetical protein